MLERAEKLYDRGWQHLGLWFCTIFAQLTTEGVEPFGMKSEDIVTYPFIMLQGLLKKGPKPTVSSCGVNRSGTVSGSVISGRSSPRDRIGEGTLRLSTPPEDRAG